MKYVTIRITDNREIEVSTATETVFVELRNDYERRKLQRALERDRADG